MPYATFLGALNLATCSLCVLLTASNWNRNLVYVFPVQRFAGIQLLKVFWNETKQDPARVLRTLT